MFARSAVVLASLALVLALAHAQTSFVGPMEPTRFIRTSDGINIAVYISEGLTPGVFLLHGNSLSSAMWRRVFSDGEFGGQYYIAAMDFPGHGNSDALRPGDQYNIQDFARIALEVMYSLGLENTTMIGHSLGGTVAIEMMPQLPNLKALGLVAAPALKLPYEDNSEAFTNNTAVQLLFTPNLNALDVSNLAAANFAPNFKYPSWVEEVIAASDPRFRLKLEESLNQNRYSDQYAILNSLTMPVMLIAGDSDQLLNTDLFFGAQRDAIKVDFKFQDSGVGHNPPLEDPTWFNEKIEPFIHAFLYAEIDLTASSAISVSINVIAMILCSMIAVMLF